MRLENNRKNNRDSLSSSCPYLNPSVINGASDLLVDVFDEAGKHVRCALGTNVSPVDIPVEIEIVAELKG